MCHMLKGSPRVQEELGGADARVVWQRHRDQEPHSVWKTNMVTVC